MYPYRAVDSRGATIDFLLSATRDAAAAKRFLRKALRQPHAYAYRLACPPTCTRAYRLCCFSQPGI